MCVSCEPDVEEPAEVNRLTGIKLAAATAAGEACQDLRKLVLLRAVLARTGKAVALHLSGPLAMPTPHKDKKKKTKKPIEDGLLNASVLHDMAKHERERDAILAMLQPSSHVNKGWRERQQSSADKEKDDEEEEEEEGYATWEELYLSHESRRARKWKRRRGAGGRSVVSCLENLMTGYMGSRRRGRCLARHRTHHHLDLGSLVIADGGGGDARPSKDSPPAADQPPPVDKSPPPPPPLPTPTTDTEEPTVET